MTNGDLTKPTDRSHPLEVYKELCNSYHAIDDFRAKMLALLPLATVAGAVVLSDKITQKEKYLEPVGYFAFVVTLGLFMYEIFGIRKCHALIQAGKRMEVLELNTAAQFRTRPGGVLGVMDEPFAAGIIYPVVLAFWIYIALSVPYPQAAQPAALLVLAAGFVSMMIYKSWLRSNTKELDEKLEEERQAQPPKRVVISHHLASQVKNPKIAVNGQNSQARSTPARQPEKVLHLEPHEMNRLAAYNVLLVFIFGPLLIFFVVQQIMSPLITTLITVMAAGTVGGTLCNLRGMFTYPQKLGGKFPARLEMPFYIRPLTGAVTGLLTFFVGSLLATSLSIDSAARGWESLEGRLPYIAIAILAGFASQEFMERLKSVAITVFSANESEEEKHSESEKLPSSRLASGKKQGEIKNNNHGRKRLGVR